MISMIKDILSVKFPWNIWVMIMMIANMGGLFFIETPQGKYTLVAFAGAAIHMNYIYRKYGLVRLTGLSHIIFWVPLLVYLIFSLGISEVKHLDLWMTSVIAINGFSLILDFVDVIRYYKGDKNPL